MTTMSLSLKFSCSCPPLGGKYLSSIKIICLIVYEIHLLLPWGNATIAMTNANITNIAIVLPISTGFLALCMLSLKRGAACP